MTGAPPIKPVALLAALVALVAPGLAHAAPRVLVVGDSHTFLAPNYPPAWQLDAKPGRDSTDGLAVLRAKLRSRHDEVVFDLATNDREQVAALRANIDAVWERIGGRRDLVLVTSYVRNAPGSAKRVNLVLGRFAARHPQRVELVEWDDRARAHPEWDAGDGVHFTADGYAARTRMIVAAVRRDGQAGRSGTRGSPSP